MRCFLRGQSRCASAGFLVSDSDFAHFGMVNDDAGAVCNHGDFNYLLMVYRKSSSQLNGKAA